jgi:hypothetical protein
MLTETETFAEVAGMSVTGFKKMLDEDLFGAFLKVMEGSRELGTSNTKLAAVIQELEVQGAGASEVFAKFGANTEMIRKNAGSATEALIKTNSVMNEFRTKNENAAAAAEKISRALSGWFSRKFMEPAGEFLEWLGRATGLIENMSSKMETERIELLMTAARLKDVNLKHEDRVKLIKQLQEKYPEYLSNIDAEKVSNQQLNLELKKVNDNLVNKIVLQQKDEKIQQHAEEQAQQLQKVIESEETVRKRMVLLAEKYNLKVKDGLSLQEQARDVLRQYIDQDKRRENEGGVFAASNPLKRSLKELSVQQEFLNTKTGVANKLAQEREQLIKRLNLGENELINTRLKAEKVNPEGQMTDEFNLATASIEELKSKLKELQALRNVADPKTESFRQLEMQIAAVNKRIKELTASDRAPKKEKEQKEYSADMDIGLQNKYAQEVQKLYTSIQELYRTDKEIAVSQATEKHDELINLNQELQFKMIHAMRFGTDEQKRIAAKKLEELMLQEQQLFDDRASAAAQAEAKYESDRFKAKQDAKKQINLAVMTEQQREIIAVTEHFEELLLLAKKYGIDITDLVKAREKALADIQTAAQEKDKETQREKLDKSLESFSNYANTASNVLSPIFSILNSESEKAIQDIEQTTDKKLANLEREKERGLITEEQFQNRKMLLEKRAQEESNRFKRKQAINDRIAASFQVAINTAEAVAKAWSLSPATFGLPWSAAALVAGGLQTAAIWAAPMPKYRQGAKIKGGVPEGPRHEQGGIDLVNSQTGKKVGEMEDGEPYMILSRETYKNNGRLIDRLLQVSMDEGGRKLTPMEIFGQPVVMRQPTEFRYGGVFRKADSRDVQGSAPGHKIETQDNFGLEAVLQEVKSELAALREERKRPLKAYNVWRERIEADDEMQRVRSFADIG